MIGKGHIINYRNIAFFWVGFWIMLSVTNILAFRNVWIWLLLATIATIGTTVNSFLWMRDMNRRAK